MQQKYMTGETNSVEMREKGEVMSIQMNSFQNSVEMIGGGKSRKKEVGIYKAVLKSSIATPKTEMTANAMMDSFHSIVSSASEEEEKNYDESPIGKGGRTLSLGKKNDEKAKETGRASIFKHSSFKNPKPPQENDKKD